MLALSNTFGSFGAPFVPPYMLDRFDGAPDTMRAMVRMVQGPQGEMSMLVRRTTEHVVRDLHPKDYLGEILAIKNWVTTNCRYTNDQLHVELVQSAERMIKDVLEYGKAVTDCDDMAVLIATMALQVGRHAQFVVVGFGGQAHDYSHVFARVQDPKSSWIVCDPVAGTGEREMLKRITNYEIWDCDSYPDEGPLLTN